MTEPTIPAHPAKLLTYKGLPATQILITTPTHKYELADVVGCHDEVRVGYDILGAVVEFWYGADLQRLWLVPAHEVTGIRVEVNSALLQAAKELAAEKAKAAIEPDAP